MSGAFAGSCRTILQMGFLDKAKQVAEQAKQLADQAKELAEDKLQDASTQPAQPSAAPGGGDDRLGTPYVPGMLGRPGWREQGLIDPPRSCRSRTAIGPVSPAAPRAR